MVDINNSVEWFLSNEGIAKFSALKTLEERVLFILGYLKSKITNPQRFESVEITHINEVSFHFAVFLADAVYESDLSYAAYPALIDPNQNPFMKQWISASYGKNDYYNPIYEAFTQIIAEESMRRKNDIKPFKKELVDEMGTTNAQKYSEQIFSIFPDTTIYDLVPSLQAIQLKNIWFFKHN